MRKMTEDEYSLLEALAVVVGFGEGRFCRTASEYSSASGALWNYKGWLDTAELWNPLTSTSDAAAVMLQLGLSWQGLNQSTKLQLGSEELAKIEATFRKEIVVAALLKYDPAAIDCPSKQC